MCPSRVWFRNFSEVVFLFFPKERKTSALSCPRRGFSVVGIILLTALIIGAAGGAVWWATSIRGDNEWKDWEGPRTPDVKVRVPAEHDWTAFLAETAEKNLKAVSRAAGAPLLSGLSVSFGGKKVAATVEQMEAEGFLTDSVSVPSGTPFAFLSHGVLKKNDEKFSVSVIEKTWELPSSPDTARILSAVQSDLGETPLEAVFTWTDPSEKKLDAWTKSLDGFVISASRTTTETDKRVTECFLKHPDGHSAFAALVDGDIVFVDAVFTTKAGDAYFEAVGRDAGPLPARLPGKVSTGLWAWRERGGMRPDLVKSSFREGEYETFSLTRWTESADGNKVLVSGYARTWRGFLLDLSLWFERSKWDVARGIIFPWFNMADFNFVELVEPAVIDGIEMHAKNIDDSVVVVTIRDTKLAELASLFVRSSGNAKIGETEKNDDDSGNGDTTTEEKKGGE